MMPTINESGAPQELADQIGQRVRRLPARRYRVIVQPELSRADVAAETDGRTDDEVMRWVGDEIDQERAKRRATLE